jgi:hypothetical protein
MHTREMHAYEMHAYEMHVREMHAHEICQNTKGCDDYQEECGDYQWGVRRLSAEGATYNHTRCHRLSNPALELLCQCRVVFYISITNHCSMLRSKFCEYSPTYRIGGSDEFDEVRKAGIY